MKYLKKQKIISFGIIFSALFFVGISNTLASGPYVTGGDHLANWNAQFPNNANGQSVIWYKGTYPATSTICFAATNPSSYYAAGNGSPNETQSLDTSANGQCPGGATDSDYWIDAHDQTNFNLFLTRSSGIWYLSGYNDFTPQTTRFVEPFTPANGSTAASSTVGFIAPWYFSCADYGSFDSVSVDILDTTDNSRKSLPKQTINICGGSSYTATTTLTQGHLYLWNPKFSSSVSSTTLNGAYYSLNVVSASASSTPFILATVGTSTLPDVTNLLSFLNVPQLLETKVPFAYIPQIAQGIIIGLSDTGSTSLPSGTISVAGIGSATTTVDLFSANTVRYYLSDSIISIWRGLLVAVLYIELGYLLYMRAKSKHLL